MEHRPLSLTACVWRRLGAQVTVIEFLDQLLPGMDGEVRKEAAKLFKKQGMEFKLSTKVTGAKVKGNAFEPKAASNVVVRIPA